MGDDLEFQCSASGRQEIMEAHLCPQLSVVDIMVNLWCLLRQHNLKVHLQKEKMGAYICGCDNCRGCRVGIRWQNKVLIQIKKGGWENIVIWDKGCCIPWVIKFTILSNKTAMVNMHNSIVDTMMEGTNNHVDTCRRWKGGAKTQNGRELCKISNDFWSRLEVLLSFTIVQFLCAL
jgi:hypothetical protein